MLLILLTILDSLFASIGQKVFQTDFVVTIAEETTQPLNIPGTITMQGQQFVGTLFGMEMAYDGETMYVYDADTEELTLTKPVQEELTDLNNGLWDEYIQKILYGMWEREDGYVLRSVANGLDRSYQSRTIDNLFRRVQVPTFHPVRGVSDPKGLTVMPSRKQTRTNREETPVVYYDVPVDQIKTVVYRDLVKKPGDNVYGYEEFPDGYSDEFYEQLVSEHLVLNPKTNLQMWEKIRDRNEILDTHVYNYAMAYIAGLDTLIDEDWDSLASEQKAEITNQGQSITMARQNRRRTISSGIR